MELNSWGRSELYLQPCTPYAIAYYHSANNRTTITGHPRVHRCSMDVTLITSDDARENIYRTRYDVGQLQSRRKICVSVEIGMRRLEGRTNEICKCRSRNLPEWIARKYCESPLPLEIEHDSYIAIRMAHCLRQFPMLSH